MQFRDVAIERHLAERTAPGRSLGMVAARDLGRYHDVLRRELARVALSESEALLLVDVGNGTRWELHSIPLRWAEVADAIDGEGLAEKWQLAGEGHTGRALRGGLAADRQAPCPHARLGRGRGRRD